jgi:hypothetical protein
MSEPIHDRKNTHGPYEEQFKCAQELKAIIRARNVNVGSIRQEALEMIALKMSRILTGDPTFADHWEDIAGYALRVVGK